MHYYRNSLRFFTPPKYRDGNRRNGGARKSMARELQRSHQRMKLITWRKGGGI